MIDSEKLREAARHHAAAEIFSHMATEEKSNKLRDDIRTLPDATLDFMARVSGVPEDQFHIHRAITRGERNVFTDELEKVDGLIQTGDIVLMTGKSPGSQALALAQKAIYNQARSSHVALVHADFVCIDAMPSLGVSTRIISDVLSDVESDWRVIRCKKLQPKEHETVARVCTFYLAQPYKILPSKKSAKKFSYCSELARKVYSHSGITGVGIPNNFVIKPANFDRLADGHPQWLDVTEAVRPFIDFCNKYPELIKLTAQLFIEGLKLNRKRFEERTSLLANIRKDVKTGRVSREQALDITKKIKEIENNMNHTFWDVQRQD